MSPKLNNLLLTVVTVLTTCASFAQEKGGPPPPATKDDTPPPGLIVPIDDHIWVLAIAGVLLGCWLYYKRHVNAVALRA